MHPQRSLTRLFPRLLAGLLAGCALAGVAAPLTGPARASIEQFLAIQTQGLPGQVRLRIDAPSSGQLPTCAALTPFLPPGTALWGRVSVGVRCDAERPWTRFVPVHIGVEGSYYIASRAIDAGQPVGAGDVTRRQGDLTALPRSVVTSERDLQGVVAVNRIAAGAPLRQELLRGVVVIQQNQSVSLRAQGEGFVVSAEGRAMTRAAAGDTLQVKLANGRLVQGVAQADGSVELAR